MQVEISLIKPSPYQPRLIFDIEELKQEIERDGLLSDLVVRKQGKGFELIDGERRLRALQKLGRKTVPVRVVSLDDNIVRRSVYKVNKIREDYTVEEEARYFNKLTDEGMTPWEISKELSVDFHWVLAHLNVFKFPENIQKALWNGQISISHMVVLESVIGRSIKEALAIINEIINRKLTLKETKKIINKQREKVEKMRIEAAKKVLPNIAPKVANLKTAEDFEKAATVLKKVARKKREKALTPKKKASMEAKKKLKLEERKQKKKEKKRLEDLRTKEEAKKMAQQLIEKERHRIEEEVKKDIKLRIKEEAEKMAQRFKERERRRIEEEVRKEMEKTSIAELKKNLRNLTQKIKKLQKEKANFLENKAFLLEALNFDCPHCKHTCVVYREGDRYLVKRSAKVSIVPEKPSTPATLSPGRTN